MSKLLIILFFIYIFSSVFKRFVSDHDKCYSEMEDNGIAVFGCCSGLFGGSYGTNYLQSSCVDCPYSVLTDEKKEKK